MERSILKRLLLVCLFLLGCFVIDRSLGALFVQIQQKSAGDRRVSVVDDARRARAQVVIVGSSRAQRHYDPAILSERLGMSVYNAGVSGEPLSYVRALQDLILMRYRPELFILQIDAMSLVDSEYDRRIEVLAPFMDESRVLHELLAGDSIAQQLKLWSRAYRFNGRIIDILKVLVGATSQEDGADRGYVPLDAEPGREMLDRVLWPERMQQPMEQRMRDGPLAGRIELLGQIAAAARDAGVALVLSTGPRWHPAALVGEAEKALHDQIDSAASKLSVPFLRITMEDDDRFSDPKFWMDTQHLNRRGSILFSEMVAARLVERGIGSKVQPPTLRP